MTVRQKNGLGMERKFNIIGVQQIAIGGLTKEKNLNLWKDLFGLSETGSFVSEEHNVDETILKLGDVEIDIMQPLDPDRKPAIHSRPLHHVGLWVDDLSEAYRYLKASGVRFVSDDPVCGAHGYKVLFIHPKASNEFPVSGEGVLIELIQYPG